MSKRAFKPYRIIGAYDSETTNLDQNGVKIAFPVLHQLGILDAPIETITAANVKNHTTIELYRNSIELYARLDDLAQDRRDYVPVLCCHNLAFDIQALSPYLDERRENVRVLAKSCRKPISITLLDDNGNPSLVIWDTLQFSMMGLARMGNECGMPKLSGKWNYDLIRTPQTPLNPNEIEYAKHDIYTLLAWLGYWLAKNPDIDPVRLGLNIVTKTGVVREKRRVRFAGLKGNNSRYTVGQFWYLHNDTNKPKTDDELFSMIACTRGGFTFTASSNAHIPYSLNDGYHVYGFDAASMHPSQMVSHRYPVKFRETSCDVLDLAFDIIVNTSIETVLTRFDKPFNSGILACYEFSNLRPKKGTIYERFGIFPLASARFKSVSAFELNDDNQDSQEFNLNLEREGYKDTVVNPRLEFGKLVSCDSCRLFLTELAIWELSRCYEWDSVKAIFGYITGRFERPTDLAVISVMQFYKAKNEFKRAMREYSEKCTISNGEILLKLGIPAYLINDMENGNTTQDDLDITYKGLKADLNSLFGIEATNEYRRDTVLTGDGIAYTGDFGICNAPKTSKCCYQFGQRIVGWSRITQIIIMELIAPHIETILNGDTDSLKVIAHESVFNDIQSALNRYAHAIDHAKNDVCKRVRIGYPSVYDRLDGIGHYEHELTVDNFTVVWNKGYFYHDDSGKYHMTIAGIPSKGLETLCEGLSIETVANDYIGYNATITPDLTGLNQHAIPDWGAIFSDYVTDYTGIRSFVTEPASICIYPMAKTIGDTDTYENAMNCSIAMQNNPDLNIDARIIYTGGIL